MRYLRRTFTPTVLEVMTILILSCTKSVKQPETFLVSEQEDEGSFALTNISILYDTSDFKVVEKVAELLANDTEMVTEMHPLLRNQETEGNVILLGTIGSGKFIDQLVSDGKIDVSDIKDGWEQFTIQRIQSPFSDTDQALVIAGSSRRGNAYGVFTLSEAMGVYAVPVYELLNAKGLGTDKFPVIGTALTSGEIAFRQHAGGHTTGPNWSKWIACAHQYWDK